jgi:hypothetical protein
LSSSEEASTAAECFEVFTDVKIQAGAVDEGNL